GAFHARATTARDMLRNLHRCRTSRRMVRRRTRRSVALIEDPAWPSSHTWRLARSLVTHLDRHGHWRHFVSTQRAGLAAAQQVAGTNSQAYAHRLLARALCRRDELDEARDHLSRALELFRDDITGQAHTNYALGYL